ncbi:MAG TPA: 2-amino-4-hydroxy-6-hydroxymethyldihydropteridine diphosphokinase [Burkholderiales bacterium]|nr:2-amino-4-hydroxy-6-hydroxymethyldihydropteridine diphosphokinase [Burkholderiales bacterium]
MPIAYIGLGANLEQPAQTLRTVMGTLAALPRSNLTARSSLYRTAAMTGDAGGPAQPDYINAVVRIETELPAEKLLGELLRIEQTHGRQRTFKNAPRTLDLDLLLYGEDVIRSEQLTIPHPRMHLRRFVLDPLTEISPDCVIPNLGVARDWLAKAQDQRVEKLT